MNDKKLFTPETLLKEQQRSNRLWRQIAIGNIVLVIPQSTLRELARFELFADWRVLHYYPICFLFLFGILIFVAFDNKQRSLRCPFCNAFVVKIDAVLADHKCQKCKEIICNDSHPQMAESTDLLSISRAEFVRRYKILRRWQIAESIIMVLFIVLFSVTVIGRHDENIANAFGASNPRLVGIAIGFLSILIFFHILFPLLHLMLPRIYKIACPHCKKKDYRFWMNVLGAGICPHCHARILPAEESAETYATHEN